MGGRQSVQTDLHRRPRSNSVADTTAVSASASANHRNPHLITGIGSISNLRGRVDNESTSDSDEDAPGTSVALHSGSSVDTRPVGFSVSHLRTHRGLRDAPTRRSMPVLQFLSRLSQDIKCPICKKTVPSDEAEIHLVMCLTRPKITYNEDELREDKGECSICLEEMSSGDRIARLPCLCIYHKSCIDEWFTRKNCCPEHPGYD
ncbi:zrfp1-pending-prov protein, putative [Brugia malayi]|uniref:E3 ubiquitin-protein ligase ZNRF1 n=1 Tax=Brugia malayi TaxID=6279 RepID=A0A0I9N8H7_BRUMA|nr:zrfp1-pending-prov protein, putative [Brugia malayi]CTP81002.1 Bm7033 [Brugia malayi]VIO97235.1 zrfp1-pending-prov protein, putative [Brugia malayi]